MVRPGAKKARLLELVYFQERVVNSGGGVVAQLLGKDKMLVLVYSVVSFACLAISQRVWSFLGVVICSVLCLKKVEETFFPFGMLQVKSRVELLRYCRVKKKADTERTCGVSALPPELVSSRR